MTIMDDDQQKLRELVNDDADGFLYHYTSLEALNGIITNKTLWASHIKYLNDTSEQVILRELVNNRILDRLAALPNVRRDQWKVLVARARELYVTCFSEDSGDRLSQWRATAVVPESASSLEKVRYWTIVTPVMMSAVWPLKRYITSLLKARGAPKL